MHVVHLLSVRCCGTIWTVEGGAHCVRLFGSRKNANRNWDSKNLDRISVALPKGGKDALRAHAESMGETVNAFIKRAIAEVTEMDNMHRAYQRGLLRQLEKTAVALDGGDGESAKRLIAGLIEDAKADIGD